MSTPLASNLSALSVQLPAVPQAPRAARQIVRSALDAFGLTDQQRAEELVLLMSEVLTNAVVHGDGEVQARVAREGDGLRVEVHDGSTAMPTIRQAPPGDGGLGLQLVDRMAGEWGVQPDASGAGKTVWFTMPACCCAVGGTASRCA